MSNLTATVHDMRSYTFYAPLSYIKQSIQPHSERANLIMLASSCIISVKSHKEKGLCQISFLHTELPANLIMQTASCIISQILYHFTSFFSSSVPPALCASTLNKARYWQASCSDWGPKLDLEWYFNPSSKVHMKMWCITPCGLTSDVMWTYVSCRLWSICFMLSVCVFAN